MKRSPYPIITTLQDIRDLCGLFFVLGGMYYGLLTLCALGGEIQ